MAPLARGGWPPLLRENSSLSSCSFFADAYLLRLFRAPFRVLFLHTLILREFKGRPFVFISNRRPSSASFQGAFSSSFLTNAHPLDVFRAPFFFFLSYRSSSSESFQGALSFSFLTNAHPLNVFRAPFLFFLYYRSSSTDSFQGALCFPFSQTPILSELSGYLFGFQ